MISALGLGRHAYVGFSPGPGGIVGRVDPGSPAARAGLREGDRVRSLEPDASLADDPLGSARPGRPLALERERGREHATVWLAPEPLPESERRYRAMISIVAASFLLLGGWVWSERRDGLTRAFFLLCVAFAGLLAAPPRFDSRFWTAAYEFTSVVAQVFIGPLFASFFSQFPEPSQRPRGRLAVRLLFAAATLVVVGWLATETAALRGAHAAARAIPWLVGASATTLAAGVLGGLVLFAQSLWQARSSDARRRLRVAFVGTLLGAAPIALLIAVRNLAPGLPVPGERWAVPFVLLVPASFGWAIAVHRIFDFRVALRAGLLVALVALLGLVTFAAGEALARTWGPALGEGVTGGALAMVTALAALAGPARPAIAALGARVVPISEEGALDRWAPSADATRAGVAGVLIEACDAVGLALRLDGVAAYRSVDGRAMPIASHGTRLTPAIGPGLAGALAGAHGVVPLVELDRAPEDRDALESAGVRWLLPVPGDAAGAMLLLGRRLAGAWLDRHEVRELERFAEHLAVALENADLKREARSRSALERELVEAHHIQTKRLPRRTPVYPALDCAAATLSTEAVGGDYYDFVEAGPREFTLAVGDAAGHGVPAALVLAGVQSRFRDEAMRARAPAELLEALNRDLVALEQPEKFMGMLCARVDAGSGVVRLSNAGLTPPLVRRADGRLEVLDDGGTLLGVSAGGRYPTSEIELGRGDLLVVHTDGLTEAARAGEPFGIEGVQRVLDAHAHRRAADVLDELLAAVRGWSDEPLDDLTIVVLKRLTGARPAAGPVGSGLKSVAAPAEKAT